MLTCWIKILGEGPDKLTSSKGNAYIQTYLGDTASSVPAHRTKASITIKRVLIICWLDKFVKNHLLVTICKKNPKKPNTCEALSVKCYKVQHIKMRYACTSSLRTTGLSRMERGINLHLQSLAAFSLRDSVKRVKQIMSLHPWFCIKLLKSLKVCKTL